MEKRNHTGIKINISSENVVSEISAQSMDEVLRNSMLLEQILSYLVSNTDKKISSEMVRNVRLVQKSWLEATTKLLKKSVKPFIVLSLDENNSLDESEEVKKNGKRLDQFVARFGNRDGLTEQCLTILGNELIELKITFPRDGGSMPFTFPLFKLPILRKFSFQFSRKDYDKRDHDKPSFGNNRNCLWLLQVILNASVQLKDFFIPCEKGSEDLLPISFEQLRLPASIRSIQWNLPMRSESLKILLSTELPNLRGLVIRAPKLLSQDNNMFFEILDRFRENLKSLRIDRDIFFGRIARPDVLLKLPIMESLECIQICSTECEFDSQNLQTFLPKLKRLDLIRLTATLLEKWIRYSKFENVEAFIVSLIKDEIRPGQIFQSMSLEMIAQVSTAFPNIMAMSLTYNANDMNSLKLLFKNMPQLKKLTIEVVVEGIQQNYTRHTFCSILLGIPAQLVAALSECSNFVDSVELKQNKEGSILNLSELVLFSVVIRTYSPLVAHDGAGFDGNPNISDLMFHKGFFKMPKLKVLVLKGNIQVSPNMVELWKGHGRFIEITAATIPVNDL